MEKKPNARPFTPRNLATIRTEELHHAARWWTRNAVIMSDADPWKSHAAMLGIVPHLVESAPELASWLADAHRCVTGDTWNPLIESVRTSIYEQAWLELFSPHPPWSPGNEFMQRVANDPGIRHLCKVQLQTLLSEIRNDASIKVETQSSGVQ